MSQEDFILPSEGGSYALAPIGSYQGVCCEVLKYEPRKAEYTDQRTGKKEERVVHEIQYVFQLNKVDEETGKRFEIRSKKMNRLFSEKATLRAFFLQVRGHDITPEEMKPPGINTNLVGRNVMIQVVHTPSRSGDKTYANIGSIMPVFEGMPPIMPVDYQPKQAFIDKAEAANTPFPTHSGMPPQAQQSYATQQLPQAQVIPQNVQVAAEDIPF